MFRFLLAGSAVLGIIVLVLGLGLYVQTSARRYISNSFIVSRGAAAALQRVTDIEPLIDDVMETYRSLNDEQRAQVGTDVYRAHFSSVLSSADYQEVSALLRDFCESGEMADVYLGMYDEETNALVYIVDPSQADVRFPGDWEHVRREEIERFLSWDGIGMLYDVGSFEGYGWFCTGGMPICDKDGRTCAFVLADASLMDVAHGARSFVVRYTAALVVVVALIGFTLIRRVDRAIVDPINAITRAAEDYARDKREGRSGIGHFSSLDIATGDEVEDLAHVMANMEQDIQDHEVRLTKVTADRERMITELSLATRIQSNMLPSEFPAFPERDEFDIFASMNAAREVGGDFYDFYFVDEDHLCLTIADVSGKGIPAALFMMASKIILADNAMQGYSPAKIMQNTNDALCTNNRDQMFVTVWLGILEVSTGKLTVANAGHEYPVIRCPGGDFALYRDLHSPALGFMEGIGFREYTLQLEPGSCLFLYTDGVPEATNGDDELFGLTRMLETLNREPTATPERLLLNVRADVNTFVGGEEQFDDLTMLCLEYYGPAARLHLSGAILYAMREQAGEE